MTNHSVYGCNLLSIQEARTALEGALGSSFEERESFYWGIYFLYRQQTSKVLELKSNIDPIDKEPAVIEFSDYSVLLYVTEEGDDSENISIALDRLNQFVLLKKEVL